MKSHVKYPSCQCLVAALGTMVMCSVLSASTPTLTWDPDTVHFITAGGKHDRLDLRL